MHSHTLKDWTYFGGGIMKPRVRYRMAPMTKYGVSSDSTGQKGSKYKNKLLEMKCPRSKLNQMSQTIIYNY